MVSCCFRGNRSQLVRLNLLKIGKKKSGDNPYGGIFHTKLQVKREPNFRYILEIAKVTVSTPRDRFSTYLFQFLNTYFLQSKFLHHFKMPWKMLQRSFCSTLNVMTTFNSESCQTSNMDRLFAKMLIAAIFGKRSISDIWLGSDDASGDPRNILRSIPKTFMNFSKSCQVAPNFTFNIKEI